MINGILINIWFLFCFLILVIIPKLDYEEMERRKKEKEKMTAAIKVIKDFVERQKGGTESD